MPSMKRPKGHTPVHAPARFGHEKTPRDVRARIVWERWAARAARAKGHEAVAQEHDLARVAYEEKLSRMGRKRGARRDPTPLKRQWQVILLDKYGRSIGRTAPFSAKEDAARDRAGRIIAREMRSDPLVWGGYLYFARDN